MIPNAERNRQYGERMCANGWERMAVELTGPAKERLAALKAATGQTDSQVINGLILETHSIAARIPPEETLSIGPDEY